MTFKNYDMIIAGSGVAGLYTALNLDARLKILLLSKKELLTCNSAMAQGGVAAVVDKDSDSFAKHIKDTLVAGGYKNDVANLRVLIQQGPFDIENLQKLGVNFDKNPDGSLSLGLEGGHSRNRIAHSRDSTGHEIVTSLIKHVKIKPNITLLENAHLLDLCKDGENFFANVLHENEHKFFTAKTCVLATGGIGRVYNYTTNSPTATGDGIYFAYKMGAVIKDLSYIQFHPTAFADKNSRECFLISEAVRGEGAYLLNCNKERFMQKYEPARMELSPRDVVSRCILKEQEQTGSDDFYLDISHKDSETIKNRFPMIYSRVLEYGFDITKEPVPIYPCQHYLMGGIEVNDCGVTSVEGLYAAGECSSTGVHGINRLASNSLLEALVFSRRVAEDINRRQCLVLSNSKYKGSISGTLQTSNINFTFPSQGKKAKPDGVRREIRELMQKSYFITPDYEEAKKNLPRIAEIRKLLESGGFELTPDLTETKALATAAYIILKELNEV
ncbi:MAG: FAD-binding protein [Oscillospiraceae bacterium]|nr:FAD-binding protein [Oscillospiraceae bacterium]